jgi:hypothetical protein
MKPLTSLAVIGASLTALGIVMVATSVEPPRVAAPVTPPAAKERAPAVQSPPPAPTPAPRPIRPAPAPQTQD